jgi:PI31 proteasome regulator N-terminal
MSDPLSVPTLINNIKASLSQGQLKSPYDAVAVFVHACMLAVGFRLVGLSEEDRLGMPSLLVAIVCGLVLIKV